MGEGIRRDRLRPTLTVWPAVGLAVTLVVGSGVLVLPGLAYARLGGQALAAWAAAAMVCVPLLVVVAVLGGRHPDAGGIAGFVRPALGRGAGAVADLVLLAAATGGAGLALVGGHLVADLLGWQVLVLPCALLLLALAAAAALAGTGVSGAVQRVLAVGFITALAAVALVALARGTSAGTALAGPGSVWEASAAIRVVFFAFLGWELMAFMSEEFVDPRRDFPRMVAISFALVVVLYVLLAAAVQLRLAPDDPRLTTTPVATLAGLAFGPAGRALMTVVGLAIVLANINGVVLAFSRLVYACARESTLPAALAATDRNGRPRRAVVTTVAVFAAFAVAERAGFLGLATLFEVAATCFFAGFVLATLAFVRESRTWLQRAFGAATMALAVVVLTSFGWLTLVPLAAAAIALLRRPRDPISGRTAP